MKAFFYLPFIIAFSCYFTGCEDFDDDPVFPASDFICSGEYQGAYWPTTAWQECDPKEVGMSRKKLKELNEEMRVLLDMGVDVENLLIVKDGYIVAEQYYSDEYGPDDLHRIYSCTKSITGALTGICIEQGLIEGVHAKLFDFFPKDSAQNMSPEKAGIDIGHLLTMSEGLEWYELEYPYGDERNTFRQWLIAGGTMQFVLDLPGIAAPGERYSYNTGSSHLLAGIVEKASGMRTDSFALEQLFSPIGINDFYWPVDKEGHSLGGSGVRLTPRDMARFGYLYLNGGLWDGEQVVPESWVEESLKMRIHRRLVTSFWYGYQFWVSDYGMAAAVGYGGQWIMVLPEQDLVVVLNNDFEEGDNFQWNTPERILNNYILPALD